jgi:2-keto-3-deoxy-L-rhamnonate aldolase RhmA
MKNQLKTQLDEGRTTYGAWITLSHPAISEYLATIGFDWFVFDQEHSPLDVDTTQVMMQASRASDVTPLVRVAWNDPVRIKKALDIGAHGLVIPMVSSAADAELAVAACRYPPAGIRGAGPSRMLMTDPDYVATANEEVMVIVQIESRDAVENAADILAVEGVDAFFLGPVDLSYSLGRRGDVSHADVQQAIDRVREAAAAAGVAGGIWQGAGKTIPERAAEGWKMIAVGFDAGFLTAGAREALRGARPAPA